MIKTVVIEQELVETPYPKLMISKDGNIVFMTSKGVGVMLHDVRNQWVDPQMGAIWDRWHMPNFRDFNGTLSLSNK